MHLNIAQFIDESIKILWQIFTQRWLLKFTPNNFNGKQINKINHYIQLTNVYKIFFCNYMVFLIDLCEDIYPSRRHSSFFILLIEYDYI